MMIPATRWLSSRSMPEIAISELPSMLQNIVVYPDANAARSTPCAICALLGLLRSSSSTPSIVERCWTNCRAIPFGLYRSRSIAASTRVRVSGEISATPRTTLDTVDFETPASAATSRIVGGLRASGPSQPLPASAAVRIG